jgi:hypothetical protein
MRVPPSDVRHPAAQRKLVPRAWKLRYPDYQANICRTKCRDFYYPNRQHQSERLLSPSSQAKGVVDVNRTSVHLRNTARKVAVEQDGYVIDAFWISDMQPRVVCTQTISELDQNVGGGGEL